MFVSVSGREQNASDAEPAGSCGADSEGTFTGMFPSCFSVAVVSLLPSPDEYFGGSPTLQVCQGL